MVRVPTWMIAIVAASLLAGCTANTTGPPHDGSNLGPSLKEFVKCSYSQPTGSVDACESGAKEAGASSEPPPGWICVDQQLGPPNSLALYRSPDFQDFGFSYRTSAKAPTSGALRVENDAQDLFLYWTAEKPNGFVRLPRGLGETHIVVDAIVWAPRAQLNHSGATYNEINHIWTWYADSFWVVHEMPANGTHFYFMNPQAFNLTGREIVGSLGGFRISGSDFDLSIELGKFIHAGGLRFMTIGANPDC
jgi:hypothetical protein